MENLNISYDVVKSMTYGDEVKLNEEYCLYHYSQDDLVVLVKTEEWEEIAVVLYNDETKSVELEMC